MTDQCTHCLVRGSLSRCLKTECDKHDDWAFNTLRERVQELEDSLVAARESADNFSEEAELLGMLVGEDSENTLSDIVKSIACQARRYGWDPDVVPFNEWVNSGMASLFQAYTDKTPETAPQEKTDE